MPGTQIPIPGLADRINSGVNAFDDLADTIANPPAGRPLRQAIGRSGQLYCDAVGSQPGQFLEPFTGQGFLAPLLCAPYWASKGYSAPTPAPPFTGGQCAVLYRVPIFRNPPGPGTIGSNLTNLLGPITSITATNIGNFQFRCTVVAANQTLNQVVNVLANEPAPTLGPPIRLDGQPDNCGNLPGGVFPGPNPPPVPTFPPGGGPGVGPDGRPYFTVPPITDPTGIDDPVDVPLDPGPNPPCAPPGPPPGPGTPAAPVDTGIGGDAEDEAPPGEMLWALKIDILTISPAAKEYAPGVYRAVCYVYMGDSAGLDHDTAGSMLRSGQLVLAERDYLDRWRVTANDGYNLRVTPYYKPTEATP